MTCWLLRARGRVALAVSLAFSVFSIPAGAQNLDSGYCQLAPITDTRVGFAGREIVREVVVELGQRVARDDVLVRLDPAGLPARLDRARAELRQAERAMDRANALEGVLVAEERDQRETDLAVRRATLREIELEMQRLTLRAPHGGVVVEIMAREGEILEDSIAMRIVELSRLLVEADLPLGRFRSFEPGDILRLASDTEGETEARITVVDPLADLASRSFRIQAELDNPDGLYTAGTTCVLMDW